MTAANGDRLYGEHITVGLFDANGNLKTQAQLPFEATPTAVTVDNGGASGWLATWEGELVRWAE